MADTVLNNLQPSLVLNEYVPVQGEYPTHDASGGASDFTLGQIGIFAGSYQFTTAAANGQLLPVQQNPVLFSILGVNYGGDGYRTFGVPNLAGTTMVGIDRNSSSGQAPGQTQGSASYTAAAFSQASFTNYQPSMSVTYEIAVTGLWGGNGVQELDTLGVVAAFAGNYASPGFLPADGRLLSIQQYTALFAELGTTYGGDGKTTFALPNLNGRTIIGAGSSPTLGTVPLGAQLGQASVQLTNHQGSVDNHEPSLALNYLICINGLYPVRESTQDPETPMLGQIIAYAGSTANFDRSAFVPADGRLLSISQNPALYAVLGAQYGGDGKTTFALPNLTGRTVIGSGTANGVTYTVGQTLGTALITQPVTPPRILTETYASPAGSQINPGATVTFSLSLDEAVTVRSASGLPTLGLNNGATATYAGPADQSTNTLTFAYTAGAADRTADLQALTLNLPSPATITDSGGNALVAGSFRPLDTMVRVATTPPTIAVQASNAKAGQGGAPTSLLAGPPAIANPDGAGTLTGATVTIEHAGAADRLGLSGGSSGTFDGGAITYSYDAARGVLNLTGTDSIAGYAAALAAVTYQDTDAPNATGAATTRTFDFAVQDHALGSTPTTTNLEVLACYLAGTLIRTPDGERPIESLATGDLVTTATGAVRAIQWMGHRTVDPRDACFADPRAVMPVRLRAGALDEALPARDLLLSPDHAVLSDGVLVQAGALVNGVTILREERTAPFTYWHVELADHALILAEGVAAETFVTNVSRMGFDNWAEHHALFGHGEAAPEMDLPRVQSARQLPQRLRVRLAARVEALLRIHAETVAA